MARDDAELLERPRSRPLDDDIGVHEESPEHLEIVGAAEVECDALLARIEVVVELLRATARAVGPIPRLDLDHSGAELLEKVRAERTGPQRRQVDDQRLFSRRAVRVPRELGRPDGKTLLRTGPRCNLAEDRDRHPEEAGATRDGGGRQSANPGLDDRPRIRPGIRLVDLQPRRDRLDVVVTCERHRDPSAFGAYEPRRSTAARVAVPPGPGDRSPVAERSEGIDLETDAALQRPFCEVGVHAHQCGDERRRRPEGRPSCPAGQRHGAARGPRVEHLGIGRRHRRPAWQVAVSSPRGRCLDPMARRDSPVLTVMSMSVRMGNELRKLAERPQHMVRGSQRSAP